MALRGWRLFGVAGTIFAYVAGILLLSVISLNSPHQRRSYEVFKHKDLGIINRRPPLQWCQELRYLTDPEKPIVTTTQKSNEFHSNHFMEKYEKYIRRNVPTSNATLRSKSNKNILKHNLRKRIFYADNNDNNDNNNNGKNTDGEQNRKSKWNFNGKIRPKKLRNFEKNPFVRTTLVPNDIGLTALASFPGSGNTWLRYLLQQSTGIHTGSVYKDFGLLKSGFPAENVYNSSVLLVKTHEWGPDAWRRFSRAILLVRDPEQSILAEFNRQSGGHVGFASPERYRRTKGRYWQQFVMNKLWAWEQMNLQWARNFTGALHIVYYDDLVENVNGTLRDIMKFIDFPINQELFNCAMSRKEGIYRRKKRIMAFDPYTSAMHAALKTKKHEVYDILGRYKY